MNSIFKNEIFKDRVALVTGASQGIGSAIALTMGELGAKVAVNYNTSQEKAEEVKKQIIKAGGEAKIFKADVSERRQVKEMATQIIAKWGKIDFLVNNAGKKIDQLFLNMEEEWDLVLKTNLQGVFNCCKEVGPVMIEQFYGRIINLLSISAFVGGVGISNYVASKSALIGFTKSLSQEWAGYNINVNAISPGIIDTEMAQNINKEKSKALLKEIPLKRFGKPSNIADAVCFLLSEAADYITGEVMHVDGGMA